LPVVPISPPWRSDPVAKRSPQRRSADNISARCGFKKVIRQETLEKTRQSESHKPLFQSPKRQNEYPGYRTAAPDRAGSAMPVLIGAALIAAAILLSTLITTLGTRFVGIEGATDENVWLVDRLTGSIYKCQAAERGKAACDIDAATGSIGERAKH
jgi:hypothetical protein